MFARDVSFLSLFCTNISMSALNVNYVIMFLNFYYVAFPGFLIDCSFGPVAHFACPNLAMAWWRASNQLVPQVLLRYLKSRVPVNLSTAGNLQQRRMKGKINCK